MTITEDRPTTTEPVAVDPFAVEVGAPKPSITLRGLLAKPIIHWRDVRPGPVEKALVQALDLLGPNGENWIKGEMERDGRYCAAGAIRHAVKHDQRRYCDAMDVLMSTIRQVGDQHFIHGRSVPGFNDAPSTTFPMVQSMFRRAIEQAHREHV